MPETLNWTVSIQALGGPKLTAADALRVETYGKFDITLAKSGDPGATQTINLQPSTNKAQFLMVKASKYVDESDTAKKLTVEAGTPPNDFAAAFDLSAPLVLLGEGAIGMLKDDLGLLKLTNLMDESVQIEILVGGDAT